MQFRGATLRTIVGKLSRWEIAAFAALGTFAILIATTFLDYGLTWDEMEASLNGKDFLRWYRSGFQDLSVITDTNQRFYGSFFNGVSRFLGEHSPLGLYETNHLLIAVFGWIGVLYAFRLGKLMHGARAGFFSALILILTPAYYGHSFNNPKDIPFAALFTASVYYLLRAHASFPKLERRTIDALGIVIGLTLGVRVGAVILFGYYFVLLGLWAVVRAHTDSHYSGKSIFKDLGTASLSFLAVATVAWAVMLVWWPYAQASPIVNPLDAIRASARFSDWSNTVLFNGKFIHSSSLPWNYLPTWFAITLPEFYLVALAAPALALFAPLRVAARPQGGTGPDCEFAARLGFLAFAIIFPVAVAIGLHSILYDANRHFLFVVPSFAVLAGSLLAWFLEMPVRPTVRYVVLGFAALSAISTIRAMVQLHPYESLYFNPSFGGLKAAFGRYETDYWGASQKEGLEWLAENYRIGAPKRSIRVANTSAPFQTSYYIEGRGDQMARFTPVDLSDAPNIVLSTTRWNRHLKYKGRILHVVERLATPLLYVIEVRPP